MNILVACEESQRVTEEFRKLGHKAFSCDIIKCSGGHPEWHIMNDVTPLINGHCQFKTMDGVQHVIVGKWDMILAFPPCTHLAISGAQWFPQKRKDGRQRFAIEFFAQFLNADCDKILIENPIGIISGDYISMYFPDLAEKYGLPRKPNQIIHPWMFGDNFSKQTCLWLKGLHNLIPNITEQPELEYYEWIKPDGTKKRQPKWYYDTLKLSPIERAKARSKTFPGIAHAIAIQYGK